MVIDNIKEMPTLVGKRHRLVITGRDIPKNTIVCSGDNDAIEITSITWINSKRIDVFFKILKQGNCCIIINNQKININVKNKRPKFGCLFFVLSPVALFIIAYLLFSFFD